MAGTGPRQASLPLRDLKSWLWIPIPVLGSIYPIARMNGITNQDLSNSRNEYMRARFAEAFARKPPLLYAAATTTTAGVQGPSATYTIVSGSASSITRTRSATSPTRCMPQGKPGFMRFDVDRRGAVRLSVHVINKSGPQEQFAIWLTEP
jgi:hypothetical protein